MLIAAATLLVPVTAFALAPPEEPRPAEPSQPDPAAEDPSKEPPKEPPQKPSRSRKPRQAAEPPAKVEPPAEAGPPAKPERKRNAPAASVSDAVPLDRTADLKALVRRFDDELREAIYDTSVVVRMAQRLPTGNTPVTTRNRGQFTAVRRAREDLRKTLRTLHKEAFLPVLAFPLDTVPPVARSHASDLLSLAEADLQVLDEVQELLAERGPDKPTALAKAAHLIKDLDTGERGARRKKTVKAILALRVR